MNDIFDNGTPKYSTATNIYDALCELVHTEEINILLEIGVEDVSYDGQDYYYTEKGYKLKEKFEKLSDYGEKMWLFDLAIFQIDNLEVHDIVYAALRNTDLAKRIGFKNIFVDKMLRGDASEYQEIAEAYADELSESDYFNYWEMVRAYDRMLDARGMGKPIATPYSDFCIAIYKKAKGLKLQEHTQLIVECRALLTSYDDFIRGLRVNQALHESQEQMYKRKVEELNAAYDEKVRQLLLVAEAQGIVLELPEQLAIAAVSELQGGEQE